jgi:site-specific DNA-methyltransferase (adenine-specific)
MEVLERELTLKKPKVELYNMDCMEYMANCEDNHFDLAIVDPPYGINAGKMTMGSGKHNFKKGKDWDSKIPDEIYFKELQRVSKEQIIWGGNYFDLPLNNNWLIWDKLNPNLSFSEAELAWCSIRNNIRIFKRLSTLPDFDGKKRHPTQKPIQLYQWVLSKYGKQGQKILDTHLGSGSSAIAAYNYKFDFVGLEIDKEYFDNAQKRFDNYTKQLTMF